MTAGTVLVACDKFKGSLTGRQVAAAIAETVADRGRTVHVFSVADGGDGTLDAVEQVGFSPVPVVVSGPTGEPVTSRYAVRDGLAVVELADACGMLRLPGGGLQPLSSTTVGLGQAMRAALRDPSITELIVGVGGSASTDGGTGMLAGLGAELRDAAGRPVPPDAGHLGDIASVDLGAVRDLVAGRTVVLASDVNNPLLGDLGAVAVYGPQKGLTGPAAAEVEAGMATWAAVLVAASGADLRDAPGAGSAGGVGFAALCALGARMRGGVDIVLDLAGFATALDGAALVITGEGSLDEQSLMGKVVGGVCAAAADVPTVAVCGRTTLSQAQARALGLAGVYALTDLEPDPAESMRRADELLRSVTETVVAEWL
nr:glycerate kinase [Propionicimonas sp.]